MSAEEKRIVSADLAADTAGAKLHALRDGPTSGKAWLLSLTNFFFAMGLYGISFWLPTIIKETGVTDPVRIGLLSAIPYGGALVAMILVGRSSDRHRERRWHLAIPAVIGAAGLALSVLSAGHIALSLLFLTVAAAGTLTCMPQFYTLAPTILIGPAAASGLALVNSTGSELDRQRCGVRQPLSDRLHRGQHRQHRPRAPDPGGGPADRRVAGLCRCRADREPLTLDPKRRAFWRARGGALRNTASIEGAPARNQGGIGYEDGNSAHPATEA